MQNNLNNVKNFFFQFRTFYNECIRSALSQIENIYIEKNKVNLVK